MTRHQAWIALGFSPLMVATVGLAATQLWPFAILTALGAIAALIRSRVIAKRELGDEALQAEKDWQEARGRDEASS